MQHVEFNITEFQPKSLRDQKSDPENAMQSEEVFPQH